LIFEMNLHEFVRRKESGPKTPFDCHTRESDSGLP
jgi:hypothetical protein